MAFEIIMSIFRGRRLPVPDPDDKDFYTYAPSGPLTAIPAAYAAIGSRSRSRPPRKSWGTSRRAASISTTG